MTSAVPMEAPICLVESSNEELTVNQQALQILDSITKPVVAVAIVGMYHMGKSYLMNRLAGRNTGKDPKAQTANLAQEGLRKFFPNQKCFTFQCPTNDASLLTQLKDVQESQLQPVFKDQADNYCFYVFSNAKSKALSCLGKLLEIYVKTISSGDIPCLENAVLALAQTENSAAVQKATKNYVEQMVLKVNFPTETLQNLLNLHTECEKGAISIFMKHSFKDETHKFQKELVKILESKKDDFIHQNEEESTKYCETQLECHFSRHLLCARGLPALQERKEKIMNNYHPVPRKGVKMKSSKGFLHLLAMTEESILQTDQALTEQEKALEVEQVKREAAEKKKLLEQQQMEMQKKMEAQQRSYEENIKQLEKKMEEDRIQMLREQEMILDHKLKDQKKLNEEGFHEKAEEMKRQTENLQRLRLLSVKSPLGGPKF